MKRVRCISGIQFGFLLWTSFVFINLVSAAPIVHTFTDRSDFLNAVSGNVFIQDFEDLPAGTVLPGGSRIDGLTLINSPAEYEMLLVDRFAQSTPQGNNSLGLVTDDGSFLSGDSVVFEFDKPLAGFGVTVIGSPGDIQAGDVSLQAGSAMVANSDLPSEILPDGGEVYFLGIYIEDADADFAFSAVTLVSPDPGNSGLFVFNLDDILYQAADDGTDTDGDGLTDWEEKFVYGTEENNPDTDNDGASDGHEIIAGTDPNNIFDVFAVKDIKTAGDRLVLWWSSVSNRTYSVSIFTNLIHETPGVLESGIPAHPPENVYTTPPPKAIHQQFYFITVEPISP